VLQSGEPAAGAHPLTGLKSPSVDVRVMAFTSALSVAVAIALSFIPLLHVRRLDLIESLKQNARM
jgi:hypothetical protein